MLVRKQTSQLKQEHNAGGNSLCWALAIKNGWDTLPALECTVFVPSLRRKVKHINTCIWNVHLTIYKRVKHIRCNFDVLCHVPDMRAKKTLNRLGWSRRCLNQCKSARSGRWKGGASTKNLHFITSTRQSHRGVLGKVAVHTLPVDTILPTAPGTPGGQEAPWPWQLRVGL